MYELQQTLPLPAPTSALALGSSNHLFAGSDDGSLRVYDLSSFKVCKAVRGLPADISSLACLSKSGSALDDVWLACGRQAYLFNLDSPKLVQTAADATETLQLCENEDEDDVLNELALNSVKTYLAFSTDSGCVGVVDLSTKTVSRMKSRHSSICGIVKFIPDRPRELVSGGYDTCLLHFDFMLGTVLSKRDIPSHLSSDGMSMSPPFIMSAAVASTGIMAAGTADGRLWLGFGGDKAKSAKKKRSRKWEGLNPDEELLEKVAEGPVVAMAFSSASTLTVSTLLGSMKQYQFVAQDSQPTRLEKTWEGQTGIAKVNSLVMDGNHIFIAGLTADAKGKIEVWEKATNP